MHATPADLRLPLPKGWPQRIRSAVIHVISLAHFSLTFARSVAANSINARIRLQAENSRLRQEIAILIEEARIKDSRMDRIPRNRRFPHRLRARRSAMSSFSVRLVTTDASIRCNISVVTALQFH